MIESLADLANQLQESGGKLFLFYDKLEEALVACFKELRIDAVVVNRDYTLYSRQRDNKLSELCAVHNVAFHCFDDLRSSTPQKAL